eukprot:gene9967-10990_t
MFKLPVVAILLATLCMAHGLEKKDVERRVVKRSLVPRYPLKQCPTDPGRVQCRNGTKCIPTFWQCDVYKDCNDNSDEDCGKFIGIEIKNEIAN